MTNAITLSIFYDNNGIKSENNNRSKMYSYMEINTILNNHWVTG